MQAGPRNSYRECLDDPTADFKGERYRNQRLDDVYAQADVRDDNIAAEQRNLVHIDVVKIAIQ